MESLEVEKLLSLLNLAALGFVFKYCFEAQRAPREEEAVKTLLSSVVMSVILSGAFHALGFPLLAFLTHGVKDPKQLLIGVQIANLGWSAVLGFGFGRTVHAWSGFQKSAAIEALGPDFSNPPWWKKPFVLGKRFVKLFCHPELKANLLDEFFSKFADGQWIVVELNDGASYLGALMRWDISRGDDSCPYILLLNPQRYNLEENEVKGGVLSEFMMLNLDECKSILLTRPSQALPETVT